MARLSLKLTFSDDRAVGPGKIRLLELVAETGSISAAAREMEMSYRRAWLLVDELNGAFKSPLVATRPGGRQGGGASLTPLGCEVIRRYRAILASLSNDARADVAALERSLKAPRTRARADTTGHRRG